MGTFVTRKINVSLKYINALFGFMQIYVFVNFESVQKMFYKNRGLYCPFVGSVIYENLWKKWHFWLDIFASFEFLPFKSLETGDRTSDYYLPVRCLLRLVVDLDDVVRQVVVACDVG